MLLDFILMNISVVQWVSVCVWTTFSHKIQFIASKYCDRQRKRAENNRSADRCLLETYQNNNKFVHPKIAFGWWKYICRFSHSKSICLLSEWSCCWNWFDCKQLKHVYYCHCSHFLHFAISNICMDVRYLFHSFNRTFFWRCLCVHVAPTNKKTECNVYVWGNERKKSGNKIEGAICLDRRIIISKRLNRIKSSSRCSFPNSIWTMFLNSILYTYLVGWHWCCLLVLYRCIWNM